MGGRKGVVGPAPRITSRLWPLLDTRDRQGIFLGIEGIPAHSPPRLPAGPSGAVFILGLSDRSLLGVGLK